MTPAPLSPPYTALLNGQGLRLVIVGLIALPLLIPIGLIDGLVGERSGRRGEAVAGVASTWGGEQVVVGPALILPYAVRRPTAVATGGTSIVDEVRRLVVLPADFRVEGHLDVQTLHRGIFDVPVYRMAVTISGAFGRLPLRDQGVDPASVRWDQAYVVIGISDVRAIAEPSTLTWKGRAVPLLPGPGQFADRASGVHGRVEVDPDAETTAFTCPLVLRGSVRAAFAPLGETTTVHLTSNSTYPQFDGAWLPEARQISATGFDASWTIPFQGRNYPQSWTLPAPVPTPIDASLFGVTLATPIDHYRMADRSVKYSILFLLLTFGTVWLIEVLTGARVHPIQYLLLGAGLTLFYLLELALAEHLGFPLAYAVASLAVGALTLGYARSVFGRSSLAFAVTGGVLAQYGYLYILLMNEDFALLVGSVGLFVMLAVVMYVTRHVDWHGSRTPGLSP